MEPLEVLVVLEVSKYSFHVLWPLTAIFQTFIREQLHAVGFLIVIKVGRQKRVVSETSFLFLMKIIVLYEGFNAVFESVQIVLFAAVACITDR